MSWALPPHPGKTGPSCPGGGHEPTPNPALGVVRVRPAQPSVGWSAGTAAASTLPPWPSSPRVFFDACDGLFTNYNWKEEHLERTRALAGPRTTDVYVGVDVFARGDVIGGGFDTNKVGELGPGRDAGPPALLWAPTDGCAGLGCKPGVQWRAGGNPEPLGCQPCMEGEPGDPGAAVPGEGGAAAHLHSVVLPHDRASGTWGGGRGQVKGDHLAWPSLCCSRLVSAVPAPDPPARPLCSHLRSRLGLRAPGGGKLPAQREQVSAARQAGGHGGGRAWEHRGLGWLPGGGTALPGDHGCPLGPGWPQCQGSGCTGVSARTHTSSSRFWASLAEYLPTHSICTLPLATSFSLGMGTSRFLAGKVSMGRRLDPGWAGQGVPAPGSPPGPAHPILQEEEAGPWYDLSAQEIQPLYPEREGKLSTSCCLQDAWSGGSSLRVQGTIPAGEERVAVR